MDTDVIILLEVQIWIFFIMLPYIRQYVMTDYQFNLQVVLEGLTVMCAGHEERLAHFSRSDSAIDENFDFIVLDYLPGAVSAGLIHEEIACGIELLFKEANEFLKPLTWQQQDALMEERPGIIREWQERMATYIGQIETHNDRLQ